ncbi:MAG: PQQ-like beta-propeller repeat protein, partial [Gammaproteobacteria bacterium]|nr:PQQ-like beta-propeller repeat protein [Gammaproteobacteria bacterium]
LSIGNDGTLYTYLSSWYGDGKLQAINPDSTIKWTSEYSGNSPAIGIDGTIYLGGNSFIALNPDGSQKWELDVGSSFISPAAIETDGTIYAGTEDSMFYAITPEGNEKWAFKLDYVINTTPALGLDGTIFIGTGDDESFGKFYAINPNGTLKWQAKTGNYRYSSPAIAADGTVYIVSKDGKLSAFNSECGGLADSPWPKFNKDNQNTANAHNENCPVAKVAEQNFTLQNGGEITLDASPSSDPDGDALSYLWRAIEMPQDKPVILSDSISSIITVNIPAGHPANYSFSLKVTDNQDGTSWIPLHAETGKKWQFNFTGESYSAPVAGNEGTVYISSHDSIYAIDKDGTAKWTFKIYGSNDMAIGSDGTIYITSSAHYSQMYYDRLYALTPEGSVKWKSEFSGDGYLESCPAIGSDGTIYIGFDDKLFAIDSSGTKKWDFKTNSGHNSLSAPTINSDGTIYVCSGKKLFSINLNGNKEWEYEIVDYIRSSPVIASDGTIYICSAGNFLAFNPNGTVKWQTNSIGEVSCSPAIGSDNTIYIGTSDGLYALNPDDYSVKWTFDGVGSFSGSSPAIGLDGTIFISSDNYYSSDKFYAINPDGTEKWHYEENFWSASSPAINSSGIIYFSSNYNVYALYSECGGLANSPWPKYRHDNRNTGNVNTSITSLFTEKETVIPK